MYLCGKNELSKISELSDTDDTEVEDSASS